MNWIEEIDDMLAEIEGNVKGYEGDVITKVRGIINNQRKEDEILISKLLVEDLLNHSYAFSRTLEKYESDKPSCKESVRFLDVTASKAEKILYGVSTTTQKDRT